MANRYKNAQFDLNSTDKTDIYTCPSNSRAIVQNIHTANVGGGNVEIKAFIYDNSVTTSFQFAEHTVNSRGVPEMARLQSTPPSRRDRPTQSTPRNPPACAPDSPENSIVSPCSRDEDVV